MYPLLQEPSQFPAIYGWSGLPVSCVPLASTQKLLCTEEGKRKRLTCDVKRRNARSESFSFIGSLFALAGHFVCFTHLCLTHVKITRNPKWSEHMKNWKPAAGSGGAHGRSWSVLFLIVDCNADMRFFWGGVSARAAKQHQLYVKMGVANRCCILCKVQQGTPLTSLWEDEPPAYLIFELKNTLVNQ